MVFMRRHWHDFWTLFYPVRPPIVHNKASLTQAEKLLKYAANSSEDFFKLWPLDKHYFWSAEADAFVAYKVIGPIAFAIADPIARTSQETRQLLRRFLTYCQDQGWRVCFISVTEDSKEMYQQAGLNITRVGASALVDVHHFTTETTTNKWWRWERNRGQKFGYTYESYAPPHSTAMLTALRIVSDAWLTDNNHQERGFVLGYFNESYLQRCTVHLLRDKQGEIVAFANELPVFNKLPVATTDLMRFIPNTPNAIPYLLLNTLQQIGQTTRITHFDLGFVPLAQMRGRIPSITRTLGLHHFSAAGLEQFKNKFEPTWEPSYFAYAGDLADAALIALNLEKAVTL